MAISVVANEMPLLLHPFYQFRIGFRIFSGDKKGGFYLPLCKSIQQERCIDRMRSIIECKGNFLYVFYFRILNHLYHPGVFRSDCTSDKAQRNEHSCHQQPDIKTFFHKNRVRPFDYLTLSYARMRYVMHGCKLLTIQPCPFISCRFVQID